MLLGYLQWGEGSSGCGDFAPEHGALTGPFWSAWPAEPVSLIGLVAAA